MSYLSEVLLSPKKAQRHYIEIAIVGFFYASLSIILSIWIFPDNSSLTAIFLTVISCLYITQSIFIIEEENEKNYNSEKFLLKEHSKTIIFLTSLLVGFILAFTIWTIILPKELSITLFSTQISTLNEIRSNITGNIFSLNNPFFIILSNNLKVAVFSLLLAIFYGAGAIFILVWNASIMGFVIGTLARETLGLTYLPILFTKYFLHGIPEMIAYFLTSLAGGILFVEIIRGDFKKGKMKRTLIDVSVLIIISIIVLIIAAFLETYISSAI